MPREHRGGFVEAGFEGAWVDAEQEVAGLDHGAADGLGRGGELDRAREILEKLRISNVALLVGDGTIGWRRYAPYDAILVAAGGPEVPEPLLDQLAMGGRMLIPVGSREAQRLMLVRRTPSDVVYEEVLDCKFVPLLGRFGWAESAEGGSFPGFSG